jgi:hypothetical protein
MSCACEGDALGGVHLSTTGSSGPSPVACHLAPRFLLELKLHVYIVHSPSFRVQWCGLHEAAVYTSELKLWLLHALAYQSKVNVHSAGKILPDSFSSRLGCLPRPSYLRIKSCISSSCPPRPDTLRRPVILPSLRCPNMSTNAYQTYPCLHNSLNLRLMCPLARLRSISDV